MRLSYVLLFALAPLGCQATTPAQPDPAVTAPAATTKTESAPQERTSYGDPLSATAPRVSLADLVKSPSTYADKTIHTEGKVTAVCQAKGCWLEIGDDAGIAHVKLGGLKFFVPKSASGKHAAVEGTVLPAVDKGHCEEEAAEQTGKTAKVELVATGVELF